MLSFAYLVLFWAAGIFCVRCLIPKFDWVRRAYLGVAFGVVLMMWLPALMAFFVNFSVAGHLIAIPLLLMICGVCFFLRDKSPVRKFGSDDKKTLKIIAWTAVPMLLVTAYILCTHVIRPDEYGLYTGQSTYGDLNLHLSIITSLRNAKFPADYAIFPCERLSYPFLTDSFSTTFMLFGMGLREAVIVPSILLLALVFVGFMLLALKAADSHKAAVLAFFLFFLNGGLGFFYLLDMKGVSLGSYGQNEMQSAATLLERISDVLTGWYQTPTNHAEFSTYNLRWSNVIADMLIPQRTTLGGWAILLPCLNLVVDMGLKQEKKEAYPIRAIVLLGIMGGALTMIHTHSQLALALISVGMMAYRFVRAGKGNRIMQMRPWLLYGVIAACLALPQMICWTLNQASGDSFIRFQFNWVNNSDGRGMIDEYFWFYIKNVGLPFILILFALFEKKHKTRFLASGAFLLFAIAEFILFQPNEYDNNKLFYVWYMLMSIVAANYAAMLYRKLKFVRGRRIMAVLVCAVFFASGTLSVVRECVSKYRLFSKDEAEAAQYIEENTEEHAVFMTYTEHINPASSLCGRTIVCGPSLWLYWHGFDITERTSEIMNFYADPEGNIDTLAKYGVSYIMVGSYERSDMLVNEDALQELFELVFESTDGEVRIYQVSI